VARRDPFESLPARKKRDLPFPFVLDELAPLDPVTRPMFGALGVYVGDRIVMILRDKGPDDPDSGVWLAYEPAHEAAVVALLPRLSPIELFRHKVAGWQKLASRSLNFEEDVGTLCALVLEGDERIGKVPGTKRRRAAATQSPAAAKKAAGRVAPSSKQSTKRAAKKPPRLSHGW
jgi:hypothetical protein